MKMSKQVARIQLMIVMMMFGTVGIFVKNIPLASTEIALYRGVIAFLVLTVVMLFSGRFKILLSQKKKLGFLCISGAAMGFNWVFLFEAYRYTSVALSTLSYYFAPTLVILISVVFLKETLSKKQKISFLASTIGLIMIVGIGGGGSSDTKGVFLGLCAALLYAMVMIFNKIVGQMDGITKTWIQFLAVIVVLVPYVAMTGGFHLGTLTLIGGINLLIVGIVHTGIIYCLYFSSMSYLEGQQVAILSYIDPVVAVILSVFFLGESLTGMQLLGGGLILFFTLYNEI